MNTKCTLRADTLQKRTYTTSCLKGLFKNTASLITDVAFNHGFSRDFREPLETGSTATVHKIHQHTDICQKKEYMPEL